MPTAKGYMAKARTQRKKAAVAKRSATHYMALARRKRAAMKRKKARSRK